jgi:vanillate O-demethylase monooxygenase subunit
MNTHAHPSLATFVRDCWYVIAWDHEIPVDGLFHRTVLNEPILVYRTADGGFAALQDRCCHRLAPLSKGRKEGDCVRCGYHGLKFGADGRCVEVPGTDRVPEVLRVRTYPVVLKNKWVFVWMGDPLRADPALLPDNHSNDHPDWANRPGYLHYDVPHLLICDNLLDFSHLSYVHANTLGGSAEIANARPRIERVSSHDGRPLGVKVSRVVPGVPPAPYWQSFRPGISGTFERWFVYDFLMPGTLLMSSGGHPVDAPDDAARTVRLHTCQTLTPETEHSTHYFFQQSCQRPDFERAPQIVDRMYENVVKAFEEDRDMITAQYEAILATPDLPMRPVALDAALVQFRGVVASWAQAEAERRAAPAPAA